jgi:hypothetical protein
VHGTIVRIDRHRQSGEVEGEDGAVRRFDREGMVRWLQFDQLQRGDGVTFDVDSSGAAINIERGDES